MPPYSFLPDASYASPSSPTTVNLIVRREFAIDGTDERHPIDWSEVRNETTNALSILLGFESPGGGPPGPSPGPNFGCFSCIIQDNDARLTYKGNWALNGSSFSTTHSTTEHGATVSLRFNGSGIVVFGTVPQSSGTVPPPVASYILDANKPVVTSEPMANSNIANQPLFSAKQLSADEHQLTIQVGSNGGHTAPYILQHFFVFPRPTNVTQYVIDTSPSSSSRPCPSGSTCTSSSSSASTAMSSETTLTIRALAGALGALVTLSVLVCLFLVFRRQRQQGLVTLPKLYKTKTRSSSSSSTRGLQEGTILTSTESILRNHPSGVFSLYTRSEQGRGSVVDYYLSLSERLPDTLPSRRVSLPLTPPRLPPKSHS
ncbi:hypothetical protein LshimejAT787_1104020 [Lyophyllum shimeji]|uniref:Uncharacterized protein n=1 Tax=Lyophyllum shimeji TaxID=47721 RepID=A0A9P3URM6_LYOSH|nr:hypothetical protein LshimejAT787_1104020 [Lyophyllum shimeji]